MTKEKKMQGSEKQVKWANDIRAKMIAQYETMLAKEAYQNIKFDCADIDVRKEIENYITFLFENEDKATFYIDNRDEHILTIMQEACAKLDTAVEVIARMSKVFYNTDIYVARVEVKEQISLIIDSVLFSKKSELNNDIYTHILSYVIDNKSKLENRNNFYREMKISYKIA